MFFDPANTGLLIFGASRFNEDPEEANRQVFQNAYEGVKTYFMNGRYGPGLSSRNIFDGFNQDIEKDELLGNLERFLENKKFDDLFVYICSHGWKDGNFFCFQLPQSTNENPDTFIRFERLREGISRVTGARVYYIVDACFSGLAHEDMETPPLSPEGIQYFTGIRADMLPDGGACILTSNSPDYVERTIADDDRGDISMPMFTHEFLQLLKGGAEGQSKYGFSIDHMKTLLDDRIKQRLVAHGDWEEGSPRADAPHFSDLPKFEPGKVGLLSRLYLFQNNHENHHLINEAARRFRSFYSRIERKNTLLDRRDQQLGELREKLEQVANSNEEYVRDNTLLSLKNQRLEESVGVLSRTIRRSTIANVALSLMLASYLVGLAFYFDALDFLFR